MTETTTTTTYPDIAVCINPTDGSLILVKRGEVGFWEAPQFNGDRALADKFNDRRGVTPAMRESMQMGSCFGWHVPGADPAKAETIYRAALPLTQSKARG